MNPSERVWKGLRREVTHKQFFEEMPKLKISWIDSFNPKEVYPPEKTFTDGHDMLNYKVGTI